MKARERAIVRTICEQVLTVVEKDKGTAKKEVVQRVVRLRALLRKGRFRQAEDMAYGILMEHQGLSGNGSDEEAAGDHETSKAPTRSVDGTVNIGRSIKFVRVAAGIKQGEMAKRLGISQNYLSLLENNKAEPSLALLRRMSAAFNVPVSFFLLERSVDFESDEPEVDALLKELQKLIHQLQEARIMDSQGTSDGPNATSG